METQAEREARWARNKVDVPVETRDEQIKRLEASGDLDPECPGCRERYENPGLPIDVFAPHHKASTRCRSGGYDHCTCDTCF